MYIIYLLHSHLNLLPFILPYVCVHISLLSISMSRCRQTPNTQKHSRHSSTAKTGWNYKRFTRLFRCVHTYIHMNVYEQLSGEHYTADIRLSVCLFIWRSVAFEEAARRLFTELTRSYTNLSSALCGNCE